MNESLNSNDISLTPFLAALQGRDEDEQILLSTSFLLLSENEQEILTGEQTIKTILQWIEGGLVPITHSIAIAKIIGLMALEDEIAPPTLPTLLEKLGISPEHSQLLAEKIIALVQPILTKRAENISTEEADATPTALSELPSMTRPTEHGPRPLSPQPQGRNIIDLRKPPSTT